MTAPERVSEERLEWLIASQGSFLGRTDIPAGTRKQQEDWNSIACECRALRARMREAEKVLEELAIREAEYRRCHDVYGDGEHEAGYAWDQMRRAGDKARAFLSQPMQE